MDKAKILKDLRKQFKFTQEFVAAKLNVAKQTIYKYESGIITNIPYDNIMLLANIYEVEPEYIMGWTDKKIINPTNQPIECIELNNLCKKMNGLGVAMLVEYAKYILTKEEYKKEDVSRKKITA